MVLIPLIPGTKRPRDKHWSDPDYRGVPDDYDGPVGLRCDGLVVVDCDTAEAAAHWRTLAGDTETRATPRGRHFFYTAADGAPHAPAVDVLPRTDIRAGRGAFVVWRSEGYGPVEGRRAAFNPAWLPSSAPPATVATDGWDTIPDGRRNATLTALAGAFRRQGMSPEKVYLALRGLNQGLCDPPLPDSEVMQIARSVGRYEAQPDLAVTVLPDQLLTPLSTMTLPPPPAWVLEPYFPVGRLVMLDGLEGIGKGLFSAWLAVFVASQGVPVLWASTEDDPEEDVQRRLLAAGWQAGTHADVLFFNVDPTFPGDVTMVEEQITEHGAGLLVLDPGRDYLRAPDKMVMSFNDESVLRPGLRELNRMAKRTNCLTLFIHHWNKNTTAEVRFRSAGSGAFAQVVRHRVTMAWHGPTDTGRGAFEVSKSNIGPRGGVHTYRIEPVADLATARFVPGERTDVYATLDEWMAAQNSAPPVVTDVEAQVIADAVVAGAGRQLLPGDVAQKYGITPDEAYTLLARLAQEGQLAITAGGGFETC